MSNNAALLKARENGRDCGLCKWSLREERSLSRGYRALSTLPEDADDGELEVSEVNIHKSASASEPGKGVNELNDETPQRHRPLLCVKLAKKSCVTACNERGAPMSLGMLLEDNLLAPFQRVAGPAAAIPL
jgi:hypothetical protein